MSPARIEPLSVESLPPELQETLGYAESLMGFTPNDVLTMARWPAWLEALRQLVDVVYAPGALDGGLKRLVATVCSQAAGCRYCQAHTAHGAVVLAGVSADKVERVWAFESDPLFDAGERAALAFAVASGSQPNAVTDAHFEALRLHFSEDAIMELMGVVSLFGLLNRWNTTLATPLEAAPAAYLKDPATD